ncbi:MAG: hypothetical protein KDC38_07545 [Planctomycetes bacterium]|nr:hypothetical protein [Planctomycetota bacterium]
MRCARSAAPLALVLAAALGLPAIAGSEVGDQAPAVEPQGWINNKGPVSWMGMRGKLVLIEKWATW